MHTPDDYHLTVFLHTKQSEFSKYARAYPGLVYRQGDELYLVKQDEYQMCEGLRPTRVLVTDTVDRNCQALEVLTMGLRRMSEADLHPIFLYTDFMRYGAQVHEEEGYKPAASRSILAIREKELLDLKGPHHAHSGPCNIDPGENG